MMHTFKMLLLLIEEGGSHVCTCVCSSTMSVFVLTKHPFSLSFARLLAVK